MAEMVKTTINGVYDIILPKHRAERKEWYAKEGWEKKRLSSMCQHLGTNDVVYYIGAEEGEMAALCQMWGAKVILFEPNPKAWSHIRAIWEANNLDLPLGIFPGFASNETKLAKKPQADFTIQNNGWPKCAEEEMEAAHGFKELNKEGESYNQITIDEFARQSGVIPTSISLDIEGSEGRVLRGAINILMDYHPKIWLSLHPEFIHEQYGEEASELRRWIKGLGYTEELLDYPEHEAHFYYHYEN